MSDEVKDVALQPLSGASISIMITCDILLAAKLIAGLVSTVQH